MNKSTIISIVLIMGVLIVSGCGSSIKEYTLEKGKSLSDQKFDTHIGKQFDIVLDGNPTTGYMWEASFDSTVLNLITSDFEPNKPQMTGSGGQQHFIFQAIKAGSTEITLIYKRPWEQQFAEQITFNITIK